NQFRRRHDDVLPAARIWILEDFRQALRLSMVLHRYRLGGIREADRYDLLPRRRLLICKPLYRFSTGMAGKKAAMAATKPGSRGTRDHVYDLGKKSRPTRHQSPGSLLV